MQRDCGLCTDDERLKPDICPGLQIPKQHRVNATHHTCLATRYSGSNGKVRTWWPAASPGIRSLSSTVWTYPSTDNLPLGITVPHSAVAALELHLPSSEELFLAPAEKNGRGGQVNCPPHLSAGGGSYKIQNPTNVNIEAVDAADPDTPPPQNQITCWQPA